MSVFLLEDNIYFPPVSMAQADGMLAIGGDLCPERLIEAYKNGIFPWYTDNYPIMWWSPDPRMVMFPKEFKRSKNLKRLVNKEVFEVKFDTNFRSVVLECANVDRGNQDGTWITQEMIEAYVNLYEMGIAHSVETYHEGELVGGLYGLALGKVFFGESMFHKKTDASKVAFWHLVEKLLDWDFELIDAQQETDHFKSLGGKAIRREKFTSLLKLSIKKPQVLKKWSN